MNKIKLRSRAGCGITIISNRFIDTFLPKANGEFVKVYLMLLRMCGRDDFSISALADILELTEKDVLRALSFWENRGLLLPEYASDGTLTGIVFADPDQAGEAKAQTAAADPVKTEQKAKGRSVQTAGAEAVQTTGAKPVQETDVQEVRTETPHRSAKGLSLDEQTSPVDVRALLEDEEYTQLVYVIGVYMGKNLTTRDSDILANLYTNVGLSAELLEYLVTTCVGNGHRSMRYVETIALDWYERGIITVEQAKLEALCGKYTYSVLKALGLSGRNPAPGERETIDRWLKDYKMDPELVLEACDITMNQIHRPSFEYVEKILLEWKKLGVKKKADIAVLDKRSERKKSEQNTAKKPLSGKPNRFHNFEERNYDCEELLKQINRAK